mgnify:CR=1 FL=1
MGKKKRMVLLVLGIIILGIAIYQYPLQKAFAQKAFGTYIDKQGIDPDNIAIKKPVKDWKQGGYLIVVTFNDDINNKYYYHYEVWTHKKGEPLRFNRMTLTIIDEKNSVVLEYPYDGKCKDLLTKWRANPFCGKMVIGGMQHDGTPKQTNGNAFRRYRVTDSRNPPAAEDRADGIL